jgi:hypothetical protein
MQFTVTAGGETTTVNLAVGSSKAPVWGAAVGNDAAVATDSMPEFNRTRAFGLNWRYHRSYQANTETLVPTEPAGVLPFRSQKPDPASVINGSQDGLLTSWIKSAPPGSILTIQHEPDNPKKGIDAATFDAMFNHFAKLARSIRTDLIICPVLMEYQIQYGSNYAYGKTIDPSLIDAWGVDTYSDYTKAVRSFAQCCTEAARPYFDKIAPGKLLVVGETGIHATAKHAGNGYSVGQPIDRPAWVKAMVDWSAVSNVLPMYYDVNTSSNAWKLSDAEWARFLTL